MDDLTALRTFEADTPGPTGDARAAARARLARAVAEETCRGRFRAVPRRLVLRVAVASTAAAAVAGTVVVAAPDGEGEGPGRPRMTTLSAAQVLHRAADRSRTDSAALPVPRDDQYFYTEEITRRTLLDDGGNRTGGTKTFTDESWLSVDGSKPSRYSYDERIVDEPPLGEHEVRSLPTEYAELKKLPTDPDELLALFRRGGGAEGGNQMAYMEACLLLRGPRVMPPGLQAAAFEALARLPGVVLDDDEADALGRHGIGVSYPGMSFGLVFERDTYAYLGMRQEGIAGGKPVTATVRPNPDREGPDRGGRVTGELRGTTKFVEVKGLVRAAVVDRMGQRPHTPSATYPRVVSAGDVALPHPAARPLLVGEGGATAAARPGRRGGCPVRPSARPFPGCGRVHGRARGLAYLSRPCVPMGKLRRPELTRRLFIGLDL